MLCEPVLRETLFALEQRNTGTALEMVSLHSDRGTLSLVGGQCVTEFQFCCSDIYVKSFILVLLLIENHTECNFLNSQKDLNF